MATGPSTNKDIGDIISAAIQPLRDDIKELSVSINGNGKPGLKERLAVLEGHIRAMAFAVALGLPVLAAVGCDLAKRILGDSAQP